MGKVVTSQGLQEFISSGKHETIPEKAKEAPKLEVKEEKPVQDLSSSEDDTYSGVDEETVKEIVEGRSKTERFDALMRKKHREMKAADAAAKTAREEAQEADRLAESQFNRARLAEQKLAETEAKLKEFETQVPKAPESKKPDENDPIYQENGQFNWRKFTEAQAEYVAMKAVADERARQDAARQEAAVQEARTALDRQIAKFVESHPDYDDVVQKADVKLQRDLVLPYMTRSEHYPEVHYHLAQHPEVVERLNKLHPLKAIAEIGKLELTFEKPVPPVKQEPVEKAAPAPITPLSSQLSANTNTDPAKMTFKELRAYEKSRKRH